MKKIIALLLISLPLLATAQLEVYGRYTVGESIAPDINFFGTKKISDKVNLTAFFLVEEKFSEALIGVSYSPSKYFSIGVSSGIENSPKLLRFGSNVWVGKNNTSLLILGEKGNGKDNYWYKANLFQKLSDKFTIGATAWRFHGVGPNARFTIKKLASTLWVMPAYDFEVDKTKVMLGLSIKM